VRRRLRRQAKHTTRNFDRAEEQRFSYVPSSGEKIVPSEAAHPSSGPGKRTDSFMKRASALGAIAGYAIALILLALAIGIGVLNARTATAQEGPAALDAIDFNFAGQANQGRRQTLPKIEDHLQ
jgi:hypothetical protein